MSSYMEDKLARQKASYKAAPASSGVDQRRQKAAELTANRRAAERSKRRKVHHEGSDAEAASAADITLPTVLAALPAISTTAGSARLDGLKTARRFLSHAAEEDVAALVGHGLLTSLIHILHAAVTPGSAAPSSEELLEAVWCCTNIAASGHEETLAVAKGAAPYLLLLCGTAAASTHVQEYAAWALGNIAGDDEECRELLVSLGAAAPLVKLLNSMHRSTVQTAAWALSNMLKSIFVDVRVYLDAGIIDAAVHWLNSSRRTDDVTLEIVWVLAYLTDKQMDARSTLLAHNVVPTVAHLLVSGDIRFVTPCVRVLGNLVELHNACSDVLLAVPGVLDKLAIICSPATALAAVAHMPTADVDHSTRLDIAHMSHTPMSTTSSGSAAVGSFPSPVAAASTSAVPTLGVPSAQPTPDLSVAADGAQSYTNAHIREALWLLSNIAGGTPAHAWQLVSAPLPADVSALLSDSGPVFGFLSLAMHHLTGLWNVRVSASWLLFNIAVQRFYPVYDAAAGAASSVTTQYPFLGLVLTCKQALPAFISLMKAQDMSLVRQGLAMADLTMYNWRKPAFVHHASPAVPALAPSELPRFPVPATLAAYGPAEPGYVLFEMQDGIAALEEVVIKYEARTRAADEVDLSGWAHSLLDTFFGEHAMEADEADAEGTEGGAHIPGFAAPLPSAATTDASPARGRMHITPAWMSTAHS